MDQIRYEEMLKRVLNHKTSRKRPRSVPHVRLKISKGSPSFVLILENRDFRQNFLTLLPSFSLTTYKFLSKFPRDFTLLFRRQYLKTFFAHEVFLSKNMSKNDI